MASHQAISIWAARTLPDLVVASISLPDAVIELCAFPEVRPEIMTVTEECSILSMGLSRLLEGAEGRFQRGGSAHFARFGNLSFRPEGVTVEVRMGGGAVQTIRCRLDRHAMARRGIAIDALDETQLAACFDIHAPRIEDAMMRLAEELGTPSLDSPQLAAALLDMILIDFSRYLEGARQHAAGKHGGLTPRHIRQVLAEIDRPGPPPTIAELAESCRLSRFHFMRAFRRTMGKSPLAYARDLRMARARQMLASEIPLRQIAEQLGYSSEAAFSAAFRRNSGRPPSAWRACLR